MKKYLKSLNKYDKLLFSFFLITTLIVLITGFISPSNNTFTLISFSANLFLILVFREVKKVLNIKFSKIDKLIILVAIFLIYAFYGISIYNRKFFYFADFSCYYNIQLASTEKFATSLIDGIRFFGGSTWSGEYGNFLSFFPEIVFNFTNKTTNSFILSYIFVFTPYIVIALSLFIKKLTEKLKVRRENLFFIMTILTFILFPIYHATAIYGQPDFFGLALIFLIISLTINYDFKRIDFIRLFLILILTFMLTITRRWYIYWIVTFFLCYVIRILIKNRKSFKDLKRIIKHILGYGIIVIIFFGITLFPMIKNILFSSIGDYSAFYLSGGFAGELRNQINILGYLPIFLMVLGIAYGLTKTEYFLTTLLTVFQYFLIIFLFTRIQNMGHHHSLTLLPIYLYWLYLSLALILKETNKMARRYCLLYSIIIIVNFIFGLNNIASDKFFTQIPLKVENDTYYENYIEVAKWLKQNLKQDETGYLISHTSRFNPDKFRNIYMPDKTIFNYLPYGSAVIGTHYFPTELFTAKYVMTTTPFEYISIEYKYNDVFNKLVEKEIFEKIKEFDMGDGYTFLIYERVKKPDEKEINLYLKALEEESKIYPHLYKDIINQYDYKN